MGFILDCGAVKATCMTRNTDKRWGLGQKKGTAPDAITDKSNGEDGREQPRDGENSKTQAPWEGNVLE